MRIRSGKRRGGFTLLEVLLASAIGLLILYGLYLAIDVQLRLAESGRAAVEQATLVRSLTSRIASDIAPCVGMPDPARYKNQNSSSSQSSGMSGSSTQPMTSGTGSTSGSGTGTGGTMEEGSEEMMNTVVMPAFVGQSDGLRVFVTQVPRNQVRAQAIASGQSGTPASGAPATNTGGIESDQRVIEWKIIDEGEGRRGLARITYSGGDTITQIVAPEVKSVSFSYFDGINWGATWNGQDPGQDNMTPIGPPLAVAIEMEIETQGPSGTEPRRRKYRHVVAIPTAAGKPQTSSEDSLIPEAP